MIDTQESLEDRVARAILETRPMVEHAGFYKVEQRKEGEKIVTTLTVLAANLKLIAHNEGVTCCYGEGKYIGDVPWTATYFERIKPSRSGIAILLEGGKPLRVVIDGKPNCQKIVSWQVVEFDTPRCLSDLRQDDGAVLEF